MYLQKDLKKIDRNSTTYKCRPCLLQSAPSGFNNDKNIKMSQIVSLPFLGIKCMPKQALTHSNFWVRSRLRQCALVRIWVRVLSRPIKKGINHFVTTLVCVVHTITMTKSNQHHALVKYLTKPRANHLTHISKKKTTVKILSM